MKEHVHLGMYYQSRKVAIVLIMEVVNFILLLHTNTIIYKIILSTLYINRNKQQMYL